MITLERFEHGGSVYIDRTSGIARPRLCEPENPINRATTTDQPVTSHNRACHIMRARYRTGVTARTFRLSRGQRHATLGIQPACKSELWVLDWSAIFKVDALGDKLRCTIANLCISANLVDVALG